MQEVNRESSKRLCQYALIYLVTVLMMTGCGQTAEQGQVKIDAPYSTEIDALLPEEPSTWIYTGNPRYSHVMTLKEIVETGHQKTYRIFGEVEDTTAGESREDFSFELDYTIKEDSLVQRKKGKMLLDSKFETMTLIKTPLEKGTKWSEKLNDEDGHRVKVIGEIQSALQGDDGFIYTVRYDQVGSEYYEIRTIEEHVGITYFEKAIFYDGETIPLQYSLMDLDKIEDVPVEMAEVEVKPDNATLLQLDDATGQKVLKHEDQEASGFTPVEGDIATGDDKQALSDLIMNFNEAWVDFANDKDMSVLDYVTDYGDTFKIIHRFPAGTMTLSFETIDIGEIRIKDERANLHVHEVIKKITIDRETNMPKTEILEYFWLYEAHKSEGVWRVHSYVDDVSAH